MRPTPPLVAALCCWALLGIAASFGLLPARAWWAVGGALLAAALAIMTAGLLSFGYTSRYFACYGFACLGGLSYFATLPPGAADKSPDRR